MATRRQSLIFKAALAMLNSPALNKSVWSWLNTAVRFLSLFKHITLLLCSSGKQSSNFELVFGYNRVRLTERTELEKGHLFTFTIFTQ